MCDYWFFPSLLQDLPQQVDNKTYSVDEPGDSSSPIQSMKIAWRYQNQPKFEVSS